MKTEQAILFAGGTGLIGQKIPDQLANDYPGQVIIAGRDIEKASQCISSMLARMTPCSWMRSRAV